MNEEKRQDQKQARHEAVKPRVCTKHPRKVYYDAVFCPACAIELEVFGMSENSRVAIAVVMEGGSFLGEGDFKNEGES